MRDKEELDGLSDMARTRLLRPPGEREISMAVSYAVPPRSLNYAEGRDLKKVLERFGDVPLDDRCIPGGPFFFNRMTAIPSYYPIRAEALVRETNIDYLRGLADGCCFFELGPGNGQATLELLKALDVEPAMFVFVDISHKHLAQTQDLVTEYLLNRKNKTHMKKPGLAPAALRDISNEKRKIHLVEQDFHGHPFLKHPIWKLLRASKIPVFIPMLGTTLGNENVEVAVTLLKNLRSKLPRASIMLGQDCTQDAALLQGAYDHPVCSQFHLPGLLYQSQIAGMPLGIPNLHEQFQYQMRFDPGTKAVIGGLRTLQQVGFYHSPNLAMELGNPQDFRSMHVMVKPRMVAGKDEFFFCFRSHKWDRGTLSDMFGQAGTEVVKDMSYADMRNNPALRGKLVFNDARDEKIDYRLIHLTPR